MSPIVIDHRVAPGHKVTLDAVSDPDRIIVTCDCGWDSSRSKAEHQTVGGAIALVADIAEHVFGREVHRGTD